MTPLNDTPAQPQEAATREVVASVAHWLNNKLTVILGNVELLESAPGLTDVVALDHIRRAAVQTAGLIEALLATYQAAPLPPGPGSVNQALVEVTRGLAGHLPAGVGFEVSLAGDPPDADLATSELVAMLDRIVQNAVEAVQPEGGAIRLVSGHDAARQTVFFEVIDSGAGMTPEVLSRATVPFFTTKSPADHPGLGLSAVQGVVTQAAGALQIESGGSAGTRVRVELPIRPLQGW